jgi:hypothetical protein
MGPLRQTMLHAQYFWRSKFASIMRQQSAILDRLLRVFHAPVVTTIRINQVVQDMDESTRLYFVMGDVASKFVNVTMPFKNRYAAFQAGKPQ